MQLATVNTTHRYHRWQQSTRVAEEKVVRLFPHQSKAVASRSRFVGLIGGTGGGKTYTGPVWLYKEIAAHPLDDYFLVAPTYKLLKRATVPTLEAIFSGTDAQGSLNMSGGFYQLPQGNKIWLGSADRPESLEGGQYRAAWLDEAGQMTYLTWVVIQARLGFHLGRALLTTTPYGMNWLYKEFYLRWRNGDHDYDVVQFESTDNPYYPKNEYERARRTLSNQLFEMRYRGQFRKLEGLVYGDFTQANVCDPFPVPARWPRQGGLDFGFNNPFVALKLATSPDNVVYVYEERYKARTLYAEHAEHLKDIHYEADPEDAQGIGELKGLGVKVKKGDNRVDLGLQRVNARIREGRLVVFNTCVNLLDEFEVYHYKEGTDKPEAKNDHAVSALRYAIMAIDQEEPEEGEVFTGKPAQEGLKDLAATTGRDKTEEPAKGHPAEKAGPKPAPASPAKPHAKPKPEDEEPAEGDDDGEVFYG